MTRTQDLDDNALIEALSNLRSAERALLADFVCVVAEIDERRLWAREACSSMHVYLTKRLGYSDPTASKRVAVARASRTFPLLLDAIREGSIHLTGAYLLSKHLTPENHVDLIAWAGGKSKLEIEIRMAEISPLPEKPTRVRKLPRRRPSKSEPAAKTGSMGPDSSLPPAPPTPQKQERPESPPPLRPRASVNPSGKDRWRVSFDLEQSEHELLEQARALLGEKDARVVILEALAVLVREKRKRKFAEVDRPHPAPSESAGAKRHIPASVRREVLARDGMQCTFRDASGLRCSETSRLEFHHHEPWGQGGRSTAENVSLVCRAHNSWLARKDFGNARIEAAISHSRDLSSTVGSPSSRMRAEADRGPDLDKTLTFAGESPGQVRR